VLMKQMVQGKSARVSYSSVFITMDAASWPFWYHCVCCIVYPLKSMKTTLSSIYFGMD
jgi:hypothetical protein